MNKSSEQLAFPRSFTKEDRNIEGKCWVVPIVNCQCDTLNRWWKESPEGCANCGMLDYTCFETVEEAVNAYKKNKLK